MDFANDREFLHNEVSAACNLLQLAFDEVQKQGYKKPRRKLDNLKSYAAEAKYLIISLAKDWAEAENKLRDYEDMMDSQRKGSYSSKIDDIGKCDSNQKRNSETSSKNAYKYPNQDLSQTKIHISDFYSSLEQSRQESLSDSLSEILLRILFPLLTKVRTMQETKQFYSRFTRYLLKIFDQENKEIKKILLIDNIAQKKPIQKFKVSVRAVMAAIRIKKLIPNKEEKVKLCGVSINMLPTKMAIPIHSPAPATSRVVADIMHSMEKAYGKPMKVRSKWNALIDQQAKVCRQFMADIKSIIQLLLKENVKQKHSLDKLKESLQKSDTDRDELESALQRTIVYTKTLEQEIINLTQDPEYLRQLEDDSEMLLELESHKKALKGLTSQYNQLERKLEDITKENKVLKKKIGGKRVGSSNSQASSKLGRTSNDSSATDPTLLDSHRKIAMKLKNNGLSLPISPFESTLSAEENTEEWVTAIH